MGGLSWNSLRGGGMDIFWNYTSTNLCSITCGVCLLLCALNFLLQWPPVQNIFLGFSFPLRKLHVNGFALITMNSFFQLQYRPNVSYHLSSRFSRDASCFSRDESRFSRESLNRLVWNILLARSRCTFYCSRDFCLRCVVKSVKSKLSTESLFYALSYLNLQRLRTSV